MKELNFTKVYSPARFEDPNVYNLTGKAEIVDFGEPTKTTIIYNPFSKSYEIFIDEEIDGRRILFHRQKLCPDKGDKFIEDEIKFFEELYNIKINIEL